MLLNGPENDGEYGSPVEVILKQRPQASPALERAPNASVSVAAVYPDVGMPHAVKGCCGQRGLHWVRTREIKRRAYRECHSPNTA